MINSKRCAKQSVLAVIKNGNNYWIGTNSCQNPQEVCPRKDMPSGVGYEFCRTVCQQENHAETAAIKQAGTNAKGSTLYLIGHNYCCGNCKQAILDAGITKVIIADNMEDIWVI